MNERGVTLILALIMLLVMSIMGAAMMQTTNYETKIASTNYSAKKAFYAAESGWAIAMGGLGTTIIDDKKPSEPWSWNGGGTVEEGRTTYQVNMFHQGVNKAGGANYIITSTGRDVLGAEKIVNVVAWGPPSLDPPAAVYTKAPVEVKGSSTIIHGNDACGVQDKPGIITTTPTITHSGNPDVNGIPSEVTNSPLSLPIPEIIEFLKSYATDTYIYNSPKTISGADWGTLNPGPPLTHTGELHTVYFDMGGKELKLTGGSHGAGILLVNGDLELDGGFNWYGIIIVSGSLKYTGGGEKNITGGVMSGASSSFDTTIGGNANILYCSTVEDTLKNLVGTPKMVAWWETTH